MPQQHDDDLEPLQVRISAEMDRAAVEALQLEIRQLAARHGLEVKSVQITRGDSEPPEAPDAPPGLPEAP